MHTKTLIPTGRVYIIGAGNVGSATAHALLNQNFVREIVLIDIAEELVKAQVADLSHASALFSDIKISAGNYKDINNGDIVVITSGAAQKPGETRMDLAKKNVAITKSILTEIKAIQKDIYVMLVANPVDILTHLTIKELDYLKPGRVFGTGTTLDTARLRSQLKQKLKLNVADIDAFILGEHGDTSFPALSFASVHGLEISSLTELGEDSANRLQQEVRDTAYQIISGKGATNFGIANAICMFVKGIFNNAHKITPASVMLNGEYDLRDITIGVPALVDMEGVVAFSELKLSNDELKKLHHSAEALKEKIVELNL